MKLTRSNNARPERAQEVVEGWGGRTARHGTASGSSSGATISPLTRHVRITKHHLSLSPPPPPPPSISLCHRWQQTERRHSSEAAALGKREEARRPTWLWVPQPERPPGFKAPSPPAFLLPKVPALDWKEKRGGGGGDQLFPGHSRGALQIVSHDLPSSRPWKPSGNLGNTVQEEEEEVVGEEGQNSLVQSSPRAILPKVVLVFHACARSL